MLNKKGNERILLNGNLLKTRRISSMIFQILFVRYLTRCIAIRTNLERNRNVVAEDNSVTWPCMFLIGYSHETFLMLFEFLLRECRKKEKQTNQNKKVYLKAYFPFSRFSNDASQCSKWSRKLCFDQNKSKLTESYSEKKAEM